MQLPSRRVLTASLFATVLAQYIPPAGQQPPTGNPPRTAFGENGEEVSGGRMAKLSPKESQQVSRGIALPETVR
jgi:hypothetical protein